MGGGGGRIGGVVIAGLALATLAYAADSTSVTIDRATVPGGIGRRILISVTYVCDPASGVKAIVAGADDAATKASGEGREAPTCDGGSHFTDVVVESGTTRAYRRSREVTATARLCDANGATAPPVGRSSIHTDERPLRPRRDDAPSRTARRS
jgi:hypothetical protein